MPRLALLTWESQKIRDNANKQLFLLFHETLEKQE